MPALYITEAEVAAHIDIQTAIDVVANIMPAYVRGEVVDYPRQRVRLPRSMMHMLQAGIPALNLTGYKAYTSAGGKARFWVHLYDATTGEAVAVIEADLLGMLRTGAAGGVAAQALARPDSQSVALFGAGWQAEGQVRALAALFPKLARIQVSARDAGKIAQFCERMKAATGLDIHPAPSAEAAVREADIVVTITTSPKPLFEAEWLRAGTHITAAGSNSLVRREISEATLKRVDVICVDSREVALREAGDLLPLLEKGRSHPGRWVELGELLAGWRPGRSNAEEITLFESQGMGVMDIALAARVLERVRAAGGGTPLPY